MLGKTQGGTAMKTLILALFVPALAFGQAAPGIFRFNVPVPNKGIVSIGFRGDPLGYEKLLPPSQILELQYAILHALTGWSGDYAKYAGPDQKLLIRSGIQVTPLSKQDTVILNDKLGVIRQEHNYGVASHENAHKPISLQQMAVEHRALIDAYQKRGLIKYQGLGNASYGPAASSASSSALSPAQREAVLAALGDNIGVLAGAAPGDEAGWKAAVANVNATLIQFGKGDKIDPAELRSAAINDALGVYDRELSTAKIDARSKGRTLTLAETAALRTRYGALFDGSRGQAPVIPTGGQLTADLRSQTALNAQTAHAAAAVPAPGAGHDQEKKAGGDGLFGMLGGLLSGFLGALFRTAARVAGAVVHGALGVIKAVIS
jgi:hypothetical protein